MALNIFLQKNQKVEFDDYFQLSNECNQQQNNMFPQIAKKKRKEFVVNDLMIKEWEEISKDLDTRAKLTLKKIPNALLHDFSKVCRIKSIPEFYANYFIYCIHKVAEPQLSQLFGNEIQNLLTHKSHFHQINQLLRKREQIISNIRDSLLIVEGFILMNQGKNVSLNAKGTIDQLVKDCESLEKLKDLQKQKTECLVNDIIKIRQNAVQLIQKIQNWRKYLQSFNKNQSVLRKIKIIYPHQAINCLLLPFYDTLFLKSSTLKSQLVFGKQEDPFIQKLSKTKKGSQIQIYFFNFIIKDTTDYEQHLTFLKQEIPNDQAQQLQIKEQQRQKEQERIKQERNRQKKLKEEKLKELREENSKKMRIRRYSSLKNIKSSSKNIKQTEFQKGVGYRTSKGDRSQKKIINIDELLQSKNQNRQSKKNNQSQNFQQQLPLSRVEKRKQMQNKQTSKDQLKILGVYSKSKKNKKGIQSSMISEKDEQINNQKRIWNQQIKDEQKQKQKIKKLLKQTEKKALLQTKQFELKLQKYEEEVQNLKEKMENSKKIKRIGSSTQKYRNSPLKQKKSVVSIYSSNSKVLEPNVQALQSKLEEQSRMKKQLQQQIKQLSKQKGKLQKMVERQSQRLSKEGELQKKKIQKYQEIINNLKNQSESSKKVIKQIENSKLAEEKKNSENLRMYTIKQKQQQLKRNIQLRIQQREKRKKIKESKIQEDKKQIQFKKQLNRSRTKSVKSISDSINRDVEIIKTKQTIEIVFESKGKKRQKELSKNKDLIDAESKLMKLQKQRQLLQKKLDMSVIGKQDKKKLFESKLQQKDVRMDRFKQEIKKQRERSTRLQENIKQMRKNINNEYELKVHKQRIKFEKERQDLMKTIQKEREEKSTKDKYLDQQMNFLKEMEKNQETLIKLLENQKRQRKDKEKLLSEQLQKKEELMNMMQIQQIKKSIEREVRKQLMESQDENGEDLQLKNRRIQIEEQIQKMKKQRDTEINQMDHQNQKLKDLISRIKGEENKLLQAIKENIEIDSEEDEIHQKTTQFVNLHERGTLLANQNHHHFSPKKSLQILKQENLLLQSELKQKTQLQFQNQEKKRQKYAIIQKSPAYKQKQKIQNLVQFYLKSPHQYPEQKQIQINVQQKQQMAKQFNKKAKMIQQFQSQLFSIKDLPQFVPSFNTSELNHHFLNLREVYEDYEADALRRQLFPPLEDEQVYNAKQLSVESQEPPIITLQDQVNAHAKQFRSKRRDDKKNFFAINKMRLMLLQDNRKQKQRQLIEQQSRKKIQKQLFDKKRKQRQEQLQKQKEQQRIKREQQHQKMEKQRLQKLQKQKRKRKRIIDKNKSDVSDASRGSHQSKKDKLSKKKKTKEDHGLSDSGSQKNLLSDTESKLSRQVKPQKMQIFKPKLSDISKQNNNEEKQSIKEQVKQIRINEVQVQPMKEKQPVVPIQQQPIQQSIDLQQQSKQLTEQQLQKIQAAVLKQEVKSLQQQIRTYISGEDQYNVYQQFIQEQDMLTKIQEIINISSDQIKNLNGNQTLKDDLKLFTTFNILVAKDDRAIEIGIGLFHKEYITGQYVCDFLVAHKMGNFLNLIFNFSRFIYKADPQAQKIQYLFDLKFIEDHQTLIHFLQFQKKCRRLGQVYVKAKNSKERKYVLSRALFQDIDSQGIVQNKGVEFKLKLQLFDELLRAINQGFVNTSNLNYSSINIILAYYLSKTPDRLTRFRQKFDHQLYYRQIIVTALLFQKKELDIKNFLLGDLSENERRLVVNKICNQFDTNVTKQNIQEMRLLIAQNLPHSVKRCILAMGHEEISYLALTPEQAVTRIQSSNSSQTGVFLSIIPKFKLLIIQAEEFLTMSEKNPELTAFFYMKHFIKNIADVKKQVYERVYIPEINTNDYSYFQNVSNKMNSTLLLGQNFNLGWKNTMSNSIIFTPKHKDLVIQKPFLIAVLSGPVERAVQGSPICVKLIQ